MAQDEELVLEVNKRSVRGRACPVCGGKIIPSDRAIYESRTNPSDVFPLWQCERCGFEQMSEKPLPEKAKHGK